MLWLLISLVPLVSCSRGVTQSATNRHEIDYESLNITTRPHIYNCRSPNMEDFTCWWHPLDNLTDGEVASYVLTYSIEQGPTHECPDYVSAGPYSCHFDKLHTSVWQIYCMNVTAITVQRNYTSSRHCLDVADIVQTEAPVNLSYELSDSSLEDLGHNVKLSWQYPVPGHLQFGWITLLFELQYRRIDELDNWKMKHLKQEPHVELLGLPVGDYLVRVRCRSQNYGLWSKWSDTLLMSIPARLPTGKLLMVILVSSIGVVALLIFAVAVLCQSKRLKEYVLPPIPKPRIQGIDQLLLKKGHLNEINHYLSSFHSYKPPMNTEEVWEKVSIDSICLMQAKDFSILEDATMEETKSLVAPSDLKPMAAIRELQTPNPTPYVQSLPPYCSLPPDAFPPSLPNLEIMSPPDEKVEKQHVSLTAPDTAIISPSNFYTCVHLISESAQLHLVPNMPDGNGFSPLMVVDAEGGDKEQEEAKNKKLAEYQASKNIKSSEVDMSEVATPLLAAAVN